MTSRVSLQPLAQLSCKQAACSPHCRLELLKARLLIILRSILLTSPENNPSLPAQAMELRVRSVRSTEPPSPLGKVGREPLSSAAHEPLPGGGCHNPPPQLQHHATLQEVSLGGGCVLQPGWRQGRAATKTSSCCSPTKTHRAPV